jgi:hypothetical protein
MNNNSVVISGAGLWTPANKISNKELVDTYNQHAKRYNLEHAHGISTGEKRLNLSLTLRLLPKHRILKVALFITKKVF